MLTCLLRRQWSQTAATNRTQTNTRCQFRTKDVPTGGDDRGVGGDWFHGDGTGGACGDGSVYDETLDVDRKPTTWSECSTSSRSGKVRLTDGVPTTWLRRTDR